MSEIVQVSLRGTRKEFFLNSRNLWLRLRDKVIVQASTAKPSGSVFLKDPCSSRSSAPATSRARSSARPRRKTSTRTTTTASVEAEAFDYCRERIEFRELQDGPLGRRGLVHGHRITFYFSAEHRVDFRELVKDLAAKLHARIELRQIGVRDQAGASTAAARAGAPSAARPGSRTSTRSRSRWRASSSSR
jgi:cell fate regulator YaaT (PSP1 superfamily)